MTQKDQRLNVVMNAIQLIIDSPELPMAIQADLLRMGLRLLPPELAKNEWIKKVESVCLSIEKENWELRKLNELFKEGLNLLPEGYTMDNPILW